MDAILSILLMNGDFWNPSATSVLFGCQTSSGFWDPSQPLTFPVLTDCTVLRPFHALPTSLLPFSLPLSPHLRLCHELGSYYVAQASLGLIILLSQLSEYWDDGSIDTD